MNKCIKCGTEFGGKFCPNCGTQFVPPVQQEPAMPVVPIQETVTEVVEQPAQPIMHEQTAGGFTMDTNVNANTNNGMPYPVMPQQPMQQMPPQQPQKTFKETTQEFANNIQTGINNTTAKVNNLNSSNIISALGMLPTFFWVPLVADRHNSRYQKCASNGLFLKLIAWLCTEFYYLVFGCFINEIVNYDIALWIMQWIGGGFNLIGIVFEILAIFGFILVFMGKDFTYPIIGKKNVFEQIVPEEK